MGNTMNACNYTMADHNIMNSCSSCNGCYQHQIHQQQQPCHIPSNNPHNPTNYNYNVHPTHPVAIQTIVNIHPHIIRIQDQQQQLITLKIKHKINYKMLISIKYNKLYLFLAIQMQTI